MYLKVKTKIKTKNKNRNKWALVVVHGMTWLMNGAVCNGFLYMNVENISPSEITYEMLIGALAADGNESQGWHELCICYLTFCICFFFFHFSFKASTVFTTCEHRDTCILLLLLQFRPHGMVLSYLFWFQKSYICFYVPMF